MHCPNCDHPYMMTKQTMQDKERTIRYKKCPECEWSFTSVETIPDEPPVISNAVRRGLSPRIKKLGDK
jgi:transcriptional regulator NrdR family protein